MPDQELLALVLRARAVLERYLWDGEMLRDDVAEVCMAIDDALPAPARVAAPEAQLERSAA
jgi:hypothetical protein